MGHRARLARRHLFCGTNHRYLYYCNALKEKIMEYSDYLIREAERREMEKETPYDDQLFKAGMMRDKITMYLALIRSEISSYHSVYGSTPALSDNLVEAEENIEAALDDTIEEIKKSIKHYDEKEETALACAEVRGEP
jgi:hypothetical protein